MSKHAQKITVHVTPMTAHNLSRLAAMERCNTGRVIDKLVRDRMLAMRIYSGGSAYGK